MEQLDANRVIGVGRAHTAAKNPRHSSLQQLTEEIAGDDLTIADLESQLCEARKSRQLLRICQEKEKDLKDRPCQQKLDMCPEPKNETENEEQLCLEKGEIDLHSHPKLQVGQEDGREQHAQEWKEKLGQGIPIWQGQLFLEESAKHERGRGHELQPCLAKCGQDPLQLQGCLENKRKIGHELQVCKEKSTREINEKGSQGHKMHQDFGTEYGHETQLIQKKEKRQEGMHGGQQPQKLHGCRERGGQPQVEISLTGKKQLEEHEEIEIAARIRERERKRRLKKEKAEARSIMTLQIGELNTFDDVAVFFSAKEWNEWKQVEEILERDAIKEHLDRRDLLGQDILKNCDGSLPVECGKSVNSSCSCEGEGPEKCGEKLNLYTSVVKQPGKCSVTQESHSSEEKQPENCAVIPESHSSRQNQPQKCFEKAESQSSEEKPPLNSDGNPKSHCSEKKQPEKCGASLETDSSEEKPLDKSNNNPESYSSEKKQSEKCVVNLESHNSKTTQPGKHCVNWGLYNRGKKHSEKSGVAPESYRKDNQAFKKCHYKQELHDNQECKSKFVTLSKKRGYKRKPACNNKQPQIHSYKHGLHGDSKNNHAICGDNQMVKKKPKEANGTQCDPIDLPKKTSSNLLEVYHTGPFDFEKRLPTDKVAGTFSRLEWDLKCSWERYLVSPEQDEKHQHDDRKQNLTLHRRARHDTQSTFTFEDGAWSS
ncbi:uncharacterized protein [Ambystoma mexicanum]|uniref:uncharacterized protein n=1 Tax=Ambystoma mexicanum TaxID=8296 RepID=UPI0037E83648